MLGWPTCSDARLRVEGVAYLFCCARLRGGGGGVAYLPDLLLMFCCARLEGGGGGGGYLPDLLFCSA